MKTKGENMIVIYMVHWTMFLWNMVQWTMNG